MNIAGCILTDDPSTNKYAIPAGTVLQPRSFALFTETTLGFRLSAEGETLLLRQPAGGRVIDAVLFKAQENGVSMGRFPDGAPSLTRLVSPTPGTNNTPFRIPDITINEIMFDPISGDADDGYVELYNRSNTATNIGGWRLRGGISFNIPSGTIIPANGYLVIAHNAARLRPNYPNLNFVNTLGDFSGSLGNGGDRVELNFPDEITSTNSLGQFETNKIHIMVDELTYGPGGRWGTYAGGGGSSLELVDTRSDHRLSRIGRTAMNRQKARGPISSSPG